MTNKMFKKPKDTDDLIRIWGWMDDVVHKVKRSKAVKYWEEHGIPHTKYGEKFYNPDNDAYLTHKEIVTTNRYWFDKQFAEDSYIRIYNVFMNAMSMDA